MLFAFGAVLGLLGGFLLLIEVQDVGAILVGVTATALGGRGSGDEHSVN